MLTGTPNSELGYILHRGAKAPGTPNPAPGCTVHQSAPCTRHAKPSMGAPCIGDVPRTGDPLLTFLPGVRGVLVAVLLVLVLLATGAGAAQGGQEQEGDPQHGAAHLRQVRGCGTAGSGSVPACPPGRAYVRAGGEEAVALTHAAVTFYRGGRQSLPPHSPARPGQVSRPTRDSNPLQPRELPVHHASLPRAHV